MSKERKYFCIFLYLQMRQYDNDVNAYHTDIMIRGEICRVKVQLCIPPFDHLETLGVTKPA